MVKTAAATEAWRLLVGLFLTRQPELVALAGSLGLGPAHVKALVHLDPDVPPQPMRELAAVLRCDASHVTAIVDRLETRGYVERRPGGNDRRVKTIALTGEGRAARRAALDVLYRPPPELTALPVADQALLRDVLRRAVEGGG